MDDLAETCDELVRLWHSRAEIDPARDLPRYHDARLHTVSALASHAHRCGETAMHLIGRGLWLESAPLVRLAFECAVTAHWVAQVPDGVEAILNNDYRSRRAMRSTLERLGIWQPEGEDSDPVRSEEPHNVDLQTPGGTGIGRHTQERDQDHESASGPQAKNFEQMCLDLEPGGPQLYSYYRSLSWFSHPTNYVMDQYTELVSTEADDNSLLRLRRTPKSGEPESENEYLFAFLCTMSLVLAASALDLLDMGRLHEQRIVELAGRAWAQPRLTLTAKARARVFGEEAS